MKNNSTRSPEAVPGTGVSDRTESEPAVNGRRTESVRQRYGGAAAGGGAAPGDGVAARPVDRNHAAVWAHMDKLAARVTALWPADVSAADAVSEARRG